MATAIWHGWYRSPGGRWLRIVTAQTEAQCWRWLRLAAGRVTALQVLPAGQRPDRVLGERILRPSESKG